MTKRLRCKLAASGEPLAREATHRAAPECRAVLANAFICGEWQLDDGQITSLSVENRLTGQTLCIRAGFLPQVVFRDGRAIDLASMSVRLEHDALGATFADDGSGLAIRWTASLDDAANAIIQSLQLTATRDTAIAELVFFDAPLAGARQVGQVDGSVVVCGDLFLAVEHPLAKNTADPGGCVRCWLPRGHVLKAGQSRTYTSACGAVPPGQLRRGFLSYLEHRRAHPFRQFLHYNNWYDVHLGRLMEERSTEASCLDAIAYFGQELVEKRGVEFDGFVWDDGWDDFNSFWDFHRGFPNGFKPLERAAQRYGARLGVWLSPWGGYASAKGRRIAYGKTHGLETNATGFAVAGEKYGQVFRDACVRMMREHGVVFFKCDAMGVGNLVAGVEVEMAADIDAILELTHDLRRENPEVFISATTGTWASPYWLRHADSVWRQGENTGFHGAGNLRQQWITYRDKFCYERIVRQGPLYPLNAVMLQGIVIGNRPGRAPFGLGLDEKSVADELWSFFGSGTGLQELYITPRVMTATMADKLAAAAKWARSNRDVLVDTHWIGGNPGVGEVYGWASWRPGKGIVALRNPSDLSQTLALTLQAALELPVTETAPVTLKPVYPRSRLLPAGKQTVEQPIELELDPFEVLVLEVDAPLEDARD